MSKAEGTALLAIGVCVGWALCRLWWNDTIEAADREVNHYEDIRTSDADEDKPWIPDHEQTYP